MKTPAANDDFEGCGVDRISRSRPCAHVRSRPKHTSVRVWQLRRQTRTPLITPFGARVRSAGSWHARMAESPPDHFGFASPVRPPVSETTCTAEFPILSLAARRKGIARCAALHLDCARSADGRSVSVAFEEQLLIPQQHRHLAISLSVSSGCMSSDAQRGSPSLKSVTIDSQALRRK